MVEIETRDLEAEGLDVEVVDIEAGNLMSDTFNLDGSLIAVGVRGTGISSIEQVVTSDESGGENVIRVTLTDKRTFDFIIKNGKDYKLTDDDKKDIADNIRKGYDMKDVHSSELDIKDEYPDY